jgi:hypothetical protein
MIETPFQNAKEFLRFFLDNELLQTQHEYLVFNCNNEHN